MLDWLYNLTGQPSPSALRRLERAARRLENATRVLDYKLAQFHLSGVMSMPAPTGNPVIDAALTAITNATTVEASAVAFVNSVPSLITTAVAAAIANGATAAQLQPVTDAVTALQGNADALTAAILANTPAAPTP